MSHRAPFEADPPEPANEIQAAHIELYRHLRESPACDGERAYLSTKLDEFRALGLEDPGFLERFPSECGARIWELRLATTLAGWGWQLIPARKPGVGPDFGIQCEDGRVMWVEATAPTAGAESKPDGSTNQDKVRAPTGQILHGSEIDRTIMLRYLSAIDAKRKQWARAASNGAVDPDDGFAVAVSGSMIPEAMIEEEDEIPRIVRVLFGAGVPTLSVPVGGGEPRAGGFSAQPSVKKARGAEVPSRLFLDGDRAPELSAVIFSGSYLKERPEVRGKPPGWDFVFALNPAANREFPFGAPKNGRVYFVGLRHDDRRRSP